MLDAVHLIFHDPQKSISKSERSCHDKLLERPSGHQPNLLKKNHFHIRENRFVKVISLPKALDNVAAKIPANQSSMNVKLIEENPFHLPVIIGPNTEIILIV